MDEFLERVSLDNPFTLTSFSFWLGMTLIIATAAAILIYGLMLLAGTTFVAIVPVL